MAVAVDDALKAITSLDIKLNYEIVSIDDSLNRVCTENIIAKIDLPKFNNSAMDGYAIENINNLKGLKVIETIFAGDDKTTLLKNNTCIKIMTGARVPKNCKTVVPKEHCEVIDDEKINILPRIKENQNIRFIGEDIKAGDILIKKGEQLNFSKITLLASQGISHIKVYKKAKIVVFSSGEELVPHYEKAKEYQIYNSNTPTFISRLKELGVSTQFVGQAKDSIISIKNLIKNSLDSNLIITSGGVSVGDADFTKASFNELGFTTIFDGIKVKPGKPTVLGKIGKTLILNLPGNPLASALIFELFGKILVQKLTGSEEFHHNFIKAKISDDLNSKQGRINVIPGFFDGEYFKVAQKRASAMVSTLSSCNSIIVLDEHISLLKKDAQVKVLPINWKFFTREYKDFFTYE